MLLLMRVGNERLFVRFEFKEAVPEHLPGATVISCSVEIYCDGSGGRIESVWFSREDIDRFLSELRILEGSRKGSANLANLGSLSGDNPLRFEIHSIDNAGHYAVRADLSKFNYLGEDIESLKISVSFSIDDGDLSPILIGFRKLFDCK